MAQFASADDVEAIQEIDSVRVHFHVSGPSGEPVAGATVGILDNVGEMLATGVTDPNGDLFVTVVGSEQFVARVARIGYESWQSQPITPPFDREIIRLSLPPAPIMLDAIEATGEGRCPVPGDPARAARLYQIAIKALERVVRTEEAASFEVRVTAPELNLVGPNAERAGASLWLETVRMNESVGSVIQSPPAESLAVGGYIRFTSMLGVPTYHIPSAQVLMSESFAASHCFSEEEHSNSDLFGLRFQPLVDDTQDVDGILWIDSTTSRPNRVEYRYTGIEEFIWHWEVMRKNYLLKRRLGPLASGWPASIQIRNVQRFGGAVTFGATATGHPYTRSWEVRWPLPFITSTDRSVSQSDALTRRSEISWSRVVEKYHRTVGEVVRVSGPPWNGR